VDANTSVLTTLRGLHCIHSPQVYAGLKLVHPLSEVKLLPSSGEFVHPGEHEALSAAKSAKEDQERRRKELERKQLDARERSHYGFPQGSRPSIEQRWGGHQTEMLRIKGVIYTVVRPNSSISEQRKATCLICGAITTDWIYFEVRKGKCICNNCLPNDI